VDVVTQLEVTPGDNERLRLAKLALGHILRMSTRPSQPGDVEEYERCKTIILKR
jgi:hypothetical protein